MPHQTVPKRFQTVTATAALALLTIVPASAQVIDWARQFGTSRVEEAFAVAVGPNSSTPAARRLDPSLGLPMQEGSTAL